MTELFKTYSELCKFNSYEERLAYLIIQNGRVGVETFGSMRYINQLLYRSTLWRHKKRNIIIRDHGRDLGLEGHDICDGEIILVHHINTITLEDIINQNPIVFDEENLISSRDSTHKKIHYGYNNLSSELFANRKPNDTILWRK